MDGLPIYIPMGEALYPREFDRMLEAFERPVIHPLCDRTRLRRRKRQARYRRGKTGVRPRMRGTR